MIFSSRVFQWNVFLLDNYKTAGQNSGQFQNSCFVRYMIYVNSVTKVKKVG